MTSSYEGDFYLTLPSNTDTRESASSSSYTTTFTENIELPGEWEVALVDIQAPKNIITVTKAGAVMRVYPKISENAKAWWSFDAPTYVAENEGSDGKQDFTRQVIVHGLSKYTWDSTNKYAEITFRKGLVVSIESIINHINFAMKVMFHRADFSALFGIDSASSSIVYQLKSEIEKIQFLNTSVCQILGITKIGGDAVLTQAYEHDYKPYYGQQPPDLNNGISTMFVYSDIVDMQRMDRTTVPLLRTLAIKEQKIDKPHYKRVSRNRIATLDIRIRDLAGRPIRFARGTTICTLHFRRRRLQL